MVGARELKYCEMCYEPKKSDKIGYYFVYSVDGEIFDSGIRYNNSDFIKYVGMLTLRHPDRDLKVVLDKDIVTILEKKKNELQKRTRDQQRSFSD